MKNMGTMKLRLFTMQLIFAGFVALGTTTLSAEEDSADRTYDGLVAVAESALQVACALEKNPAVAKVN